MTHTDDRKIDPRYVEKMNDLAHDLDAIFNGGLKGKDRKVAFVLLITEFDKMEGRVNYISNTLRKDTIKMLKEIITRFEGKPDAI